MRMHVQFANGGRAEVLLLAAGRREMRVIVEGSASTDRWERVDGAWRDENGAPIEIEAVFAVDGTEWQAFCSQLGNATMAMGSSHV